MREWGVGSREGGKKRRREEEAGKLSKQCY
jgi:hypothetical protein